MLYCTTGHLHYATGHLHYATGHLNVALLCQGSYSMTLNHLMLVMRQVTLKAHSNSTTPGASVNFTFSSGREGT